MVQFLFALAIIASGFPTYAVRTQGEQMVPPPDDDVPSVTVEDITLKLEEGEKVHLNGQLHYLASLLGSPDIYHRLARARSLRIGDFPQRTGEGTGKIDVKEEIARVTVVARIQLLQALRGLMEGRLAEELVTWFGDDRASTRAYAEELLTRMLLVCSNLDLQFDALEPWAAQARRADACERPSYQKSVAGFVLRAGQVLLSAADGRAELHAAWLGVLLHMVSHIVKDEGTTLRRAGGWKGDGPGSSCGDDGRLGTVDYRSCIGEGYDRACKDLAETNSRDARHNADNVRHFIEASTIAEQRLGNAVNITADGRVQGSFSIDASSGPEMSLWSAGFAAPGPRRSHDKEHRSFAFAPSRLRLVLGILSLQYCHRQA